MLVSASFGGVTVAGAEFSSTSIEFSSSKEGTLNRNLLPLIGTLVDGVKLTGLEALILLFTLRIEDGVMHAFI